MEDGRAGNVCDRTTTGTTSMLSLTKSACFSIAALRFARITVNRPVRAVTGYDIESTREQGAVDEPEPIDICVQLPDGSVLRYHLGRHNLLVAGDGPVAFRRPIVNM